MGFQDCFLLKTKVCGENKNSGSWIAQTITDKDYLHQPENKNQHYIFMTKKLIIALLVMLLGSKCSSWECAVCGY